MVPRSPDHSSNKIAGTFVERKKRCIAGEAACGGTKCAGKIYRQSSEIADLQCNPLQCVFSLPVQMKVVGLAAIFSGSNEVVEFRSLHLPKKGSCAPTP